MVPSPMRAGGVMRGLDHQSGSLFSDVDLEKRIRPDHPLRTIRRLVDDALASMDRAFADRYCEFGRPSIPPERLLRAMLLQDSCRALAGVLLDPLRDRKSTRLN